MKFIKRHHHETLSGHLKISKKPAKDLFPDLRGQEPIALYYSSIFIIRRLIIVGIVVLAIENTMI